jgi:hypothetical protein
MRPIVQKWLVLVTASMGLYLLPDRGLAQNENDQGNDPIVGSWILHATVGSFKVEALESFWSDGITVSSNLNDGTAYGVWRRSGSCYFVKVVWIIPPAQGESPGTTRTSLPGPLMINPQGTEITGPFHGFDTTPDGTVIGTFSGTLVLDRISFTSNP